MAISDKQAEHLAKRAAHWNAISIQKYDGSLFSKAYHHRLGELYKYQVGAGLRVLEIGCGQGALLASLKPSRGVGVDIASEMVSAAVNKYPHLHFMVADAHSFKLDETFDVIILSDLINDVWDVQSILLHIRQYCTPSTRIIFNYYSRVVQPLLSLGSSMGLAQTLMAQNWFTPADLENIIALAGYEQVSHSQEILVPVPWIGTFFNRFLVKVWPFSAFAWTNLTIARPVSTDAQPELSVSIVVPARNEAGNIENAFTRLPKFGKSQELIFVEGNSTDDTYQVIEAAIANHPETKASLYKQPGKGKADAVRVGFDKATGDILMILDADLTVQPEDLGRFYNAIRDGKGEFINGVRLVYPMGDQAMRFLNLVGNKFFSLAFTWLLGQPIKDTLCGTKVISRENYQKLAANRAYFGEFDPFGDYDLIFGASKLNLKIIDMPIRYQDRTYGSTNIDRWRHGALLFKMLFIAAKRLKFT